MLNIDDQAECPLCMEPLEMDDINFFPCTCGYQICRFCWHRIRTDENGLCPACRKAYPECPADFKPLSEEQLHRIKNEKRQKDIQRKQKITENRKHLASVRVVQKNLVFVVGLSQRLADTEILKKQEYFGKFGKILKVVINQNTSYAGNQSHGPSASAYVTYQKAEDSLRAIQAVNNVHVDGRTLKASLGTTKYCSHFLRNSPCPKLDCMYLHELGDEAASFTKEDMQMGKHQEYEEKLLHDLLGGGSSQAHSPGAATHNHNHTATAATSATTNSSSAATNAATSGAGGTTEKIKSHSRKKQSSPLTTQSSNRASPNPAPETWPSLSKTNGTVGGETKPPEDTTTQNSHTTQHTPPTENNEQRDPPRQPIPPATHTTNGPVPHIADTALHSRGSAAPPIDIPQRRVLGNGTALATTPQDSSPQVQSLPDLLPPPVTDTRQPAAPPPLGAPPNLPPPRQPFSGDLANLFGGNGFFPPPSLARHVPSVPVGMQPRSEWSEGGGWTMAQELLPVESQTDWQAAFGFASEAKDKHNDDDLGFDPWKESSQGLADLLEKELQLTPPTALTPPTKLTQPPPGFGMPNHCLPFSSAPRLVRPDASGSKILPWMQSQAPPRGPPTSEAPPTQPLPRHPTANHVPRFHPVSGHSPQATHPMNDNVHLKNWQDGLRALLPNINISFGPSQQHQSFMSEMSRVSALQNSGDSWVGSPTGSSWAVQDPAIISIRTAPSASNSREASSTEAGEEKPHWLESLQNLTETDSPTQIQSQQTNHFFPAEHIHNRGSSWSNHLPPPGFNPPVRPHSQTTEPHKIENL
ncbi:CCR4-NOT transcription complex subunit 4-like isoform X1 [Diadema antillarum]|uniref:CCR4-NOT transcription complex subunit 4-like isoform X1 n=1 Tax=Diadema antillarum TaxID=105358 RepID=UPI003A84AB0A